MVMLLFSFLEHWLDHIKNLALELAFFDKLAIRSRDCLATWQIANDASEHSRQLLVADLAMISKQRVHEAWKS